MTWRDLTRGRRRAAALAEHFGSAFEPMRRERSWWPTGSKEPGWVLLRVREVGPAEAVTSDEFRRWMLHTLRQWGATRSGTITQGGLTRRLTAPDFVDDLGRAADVTLAGFDPTVHGGLLARLFGSLEGIKSSDAQVVAVSKTLYHLLPELVVPFDNQITCGFFGWTALPPRAQEAWLVEVYAILAGVARAVGPDALSELGRPDWPRDRAVAEALRLGQARVVDLGMEGYRRSANEAWYVD